MVLLVDGLLGVWGCFLYTTMAIAFDAFTVNPTILGPWEKRKKKRKEKGQTPQMNRLKASHRITIIDKNEIYQ